MNFLAISGALLILLSVGLGWVLVAKRYLGLEIAKRIFRDDKKLVKCHMEYALMAVILFAFYSLNVHLPLLLILPTCIGAFLNPSLLLVMSIKPDVNTAIGSPFSLVSTLSFLITTFGFVGSAAIILFQMI